MWYDSLVPAELPKQALDDAAAAIAFAQGVRAVHRRRSAKTSKQRQADIEIALARLKDAMRPLKSAIGKFPYGPQTDAAEDNRQAIREASLAIQRERRKLFKMRPQEKVNDLAV